MKWRSDHGTYLENLRTYQVSHLSAFVAQLVEQCTGNAEVMGLNSTEAT